MEGSMEAVLCSSSIIVLGSAIHATLGYGASLVWMTTLPLLMTVPTAVALTAPLRVGLSCLVLLKGNSSSSCSSSSSSGVGRGLSERLEQVRFLLLGLPFGIGGGYSALTTLSPPAARFLLGLVIVGYVAWTAAPAADDADKKHDDGSTAKKSNSVLPHYRTQQRSSLTRNNSYKHVLAVIMGVCSGFLNATFGTGAPPLLVYSREVSWDPSHFRSNMQLIFLVTNILSVSRMIVGGIVTLQTLTQTLLLCPSMIVGGYVGTVYLAPKIKKETFRKVVLLSLAAMGCMYLIEGAVSISSFSFSNVLLPSGAEGTRSNIELTKSFITHRLKKQT